jgi:GNAT superfamily N-acetyltransferase
VAVAPHWQRRGIGRAMIRQAIEFCRAKGCYKLALSSNVRRGPAHAFYESLGFRRHGYSFTVEL